MIMAKIYILAELDGILTILENRLRQYGVITQIDETYTKILSCPVQMDIIDTNYREMGLIIFILFDILKELCDKNDIDIRVSKPHFAKYYEFYVERKCKNEDKK